MKRILVTLTVLAMSFGFASAQLKPEAGSVGLGFRVSGLANVAFTSFQQTGLAGQQLPDDLGLFGGTSVSVSALVPQEMLFGRYYLSSDLALRAGLGINSLSMKNSSTDSVGSAIQTDEMQTSAFSFGLGVGVEKHFASAASKVDPYAGAQINFGMISGVKQTFTSNLNTDPSVDIDQTSELAGGSSFGIDLLAGFNYFFTDNFAIGAEMSWGFSSVGVGGDWMQTTTTTVSGATPVTTETRGTEKISASGFGVGTTAGVNASIFW